MLKNLYKQNIYYSVFSIFSFLEKKRQNQFILVIFFSFFASFLEVASLGVLVPFLKIVLDNSISNFVNEDLFYIKKIFNINTLKEFIVFFSIIFIFFSLLSGFFRIYLLSYIIKLANLSSADIGIEVYKKTLFQSYQDHTKEGSSFVISGIVKKIQDVTVILFSVVNFFSSILIFFSIFLFIVYLDPLIILTSIIFFSLIYVLFSIYIKKKLISNSELIAKEETAIVKALQEGMGSIRDVLLNHAQNFYIKIYKSSILNLNKSNSENEFLNQSPRLFMEMIVIVFVGTLILLLSFFVDSPIGSLTSIGVLILASQKILPLINKIYVSWTTLHGKKSSLEDILFLLKKKTEILETNKNQFFSINNIQFNNVFFKYEVSNDYIFEDLNIFLNLKKKIGIIGRSGSGKSTFLDLLTGLLKPSKGEILIGEKILNSETDFYWKNQLSYISQETYLLDSSFLNNIALNDHFSIINKEHAIDCAKKAMIHDFIISNGGYDVVVGERGVRLSGGQKQRIGIARALYKKSNLIIFDEATSALDYQTEEEVFQSIDRLNKDLTVIIVSHRLPFLKNCDEVYEIKEKKIMKIK
jgi:ATP-binding cassette subfamily B protein